MVPKFGLKGNLGESWGQSVYLPQQSLIMTLYRSIACSILLTVTIAETVPDAKQAFEKYVKERDFMKGIYMFFSWSKWVAPMCSIKKEISQRI